MGVGTNYNPRIVTEDLVLCLDAANPKSYPGSGTTWFDLSGKAHNGILVNGPIYSANDKGLIALDGVNDYIDCGLINGVDSSLTGLTVSTWVLLNDLSITRFISENGTNNATNTFYMAYQTNITPFGFTFLIRGPGNLDYAELNNNITISSNIWYNVTGVWTPGERIRGYVNGIETHVNTSGAAQSSLIDGNTNVIVGSRAGSSLFFDGDISQFKIYNKALTATEIAQNFNATRGRYGI
jgi:hypothetical protein